MLQHHLSVKVCEKLSEDVTQLNANQLSLALTLKSAWEASKPKQMPGLLKTLATLGHFSELKNALLVWPRLIDSHQQNCNAMQRNATQRNAIQSCCQCVCWFFLSH